MDLSVIIISYNTKSITVNCIKSLIKNTKKINYEIIVVDNASKDASVEELKKVFKKNKNIKIIKNSKNLGFAKANNIGASKASGKYLLFLNSDTLINSNVLKEMASWMDKHKYVGASTCALKNNDGTLQGSGGYFPNLFRVFNWMFFIEDIPFLDKFIKPFHPVHGKSPFYKGLGQFKNKKEQDWITGAFFLTRKELFEKLGKFDQDYFMYTEEVDLCYRIRELGYKVLYLPRWEIVHLGGASSTKEFPILSEYKGVRLFYKKNMPESHFPILRVFLKAGAIIRAIIFGVLEGKDAYEIYIKAYKIA